MIIQFIFQPLEFHQHSKSSRDLADKGGNCGEIFYPTYYWLCNGQKCVASEFSFTKNNTFSFANEKFRLKLCNYFARPTRIFVHDSPPFSQDTGDVGELWFVWQEFEKLDIQKTSFISTNNYNFNNLAT